MLDRVNSLLLSAPAMFHFVNHFRLIGLDQATNLLVFSGGPDVEPWTFKPASDIELSPIERARSLRRESGLFSTAVHLVWQFSTKAFFKLYHRLSVTTERSLSHRVLSS